jgi:hypothetical protein
VDFRWDGWVGFTADDRAPKWKEPPEGGPKKQTWIRSSVRTINFNSVQTIHRVRLEHTLRKSYPTGHEIATLKLAPRTNAVKC